MKSSVSPAQRTLTRTCWIPLPIMAPTRCSVCLDLLMLSSLPSAALARSESHIRLSLVLNHGSKSFNLNWLPFALPGTDLPGHSQCQAARLLHLAQAQLLACLCLSQHLPLRACDSLPVLPYPPQGSLQSSRGIRFCLRLAVWLWFVPE